MNKRDIDIVHGCLRGDKSFERLLVETYAAELMTVSRRYARTWEEAEDVLQDAFIKIFNHIDQFDEKKGELYYWMRTIVIRTALRDYKRKFPRTEDITAAAQIQENKIIDVVDKLQEEDLLNIISKIPDGYRQVFNLYVIDGFSHKEISQILSISESTSRSQLTRAKSILRRKLKNYKSYAKCIPITLTMTLGID